jgi:hypothetical protein
MNLNDVSDLASFAKKLAVTVGSLKKWMDSNSVKPVGAFGSTNVYSIAEMQKAVEDHSQSGKTMRSLGYVHPDQHKDVVDHRDRLIRMVTENEAEIERMSESLRLLAALEAAGVDNWEGYDHAMRILNGDEDEDHGDHSEYENFAPLTDEMIRERAAEFGVTISE